MKLIPNFDYDTMPYVISMDTLGIALIDVRNLKAYHIIENVYCGVFQ